MYGEYYDWIVSSSRPQGFPTEIHCDFELPLLPIKLDNGVLIHESFDNSVVEGIISNGLLTTSRNTDYIVISKDDDDDDTTEFTVSLSLFISNDAYYGTIVEIGGIVYSLDQSTTKPMIKIGDETVFKSSNSLTNSDTWQTSSRGTDGIWHTPVKFKFFSLTITYGDGVLKTYINGLLDQYVEIEEELVLSLGIVRIGGFDGFVDDVWIYNRVINEEEVKSIFEHLKFI
jgi:hypothetical protein